MMFVTAIDDSEADTDSKVTNYNSLTENTVDSVMKKKRVRKRKSKNSRQQDGQFDNERDQMETSASDAKEEDSSKKPKIIDSRIISVGKHIRFNDTEDEDTCRMEKLVSNDTIESSMNKRSSKNLSALLALKNSSTPLTFTKKIKDNSIKMENMPTPIVSMINEIDMESPIEEKCIKNKTKNDITIKKTESTKDFNEEAYFPKNLLKMRLETFPVMSRKPRVGDIIGFKVCVYTLYLVKASKYFYIMP